jgi:hypothetical protein
MTAHLHASLNAAARLAIATDAGIINLERWAKTYRCTPADVAEALRAAANLKLPEEIASTVPTIDGEGK